MVMIILCFLAQYELGVIFPKSLQRQSVLSIFATRPQKRNFIVPRAFLSLDFQCRADVSEPE